MGTYYRVLCPERREFFDPEDLGYPCNPHGHGIKDGPVTLGPTMNLVGYYMIHGAWQGKLIEIIGDYSDDYDCKGWTDVTKQIIELFPKGWQVEAQREGRNWPVTYLDPKRDF